MAQNERNWEDLGQNIQNIIDRAVSQRDFQKLNQTVAQLIGKVDDLDIPALRKSAKPQAQPSRTETVTRVPVQSFYGKTGGKTAAGILQVVGGGVVTALMTLVLLSGLVMELVFSLGGTLAVTLAVGLTGLTGGIWLLGSGIGRLNRLSRFRNYCRTLGDKTHCTLEKLALGVGKSEKFVRRDVKKLISQGLFLQGHLDKEQTRLITSHETYQQFEQSRLLLEQRQQQEAEEARLRSERKYAPQVQDVLDKGDKFLAQIRSCNDRIPGYEISAKISRMEHIVERIFDQAERDPQIVPDLKKMMDYYLPMTVKLLEAYAQMDAQSIQGENIRASKKEIEDTLDTLNVAFEKLLDSVFADLALDVSSDISVLNTLLAQEGLTEDGIGS